MGIPLLQGWFHALALRHSSLKGARRLGQCEPRDPPEENVRLVRRNRMFTGERKNQAFRSSTVNIDLGLDFW